MRARGICAALMFGSDTSILLHLGGCKYNKPFRADWMLGTREEEKERGGGRQSKDRPDGERPLMRGDKGDLISDSQLILRGSADGFLRNPSLCMEGSLFDSLILI